MKPANSLIALCLLGLLAVCFGDERTMSSSDLVSRLKKEHPRLLISKDAVARMKRLVQTNETARKWYEHLKANAQKPLAEPASLYNIPDGLRLLGVSRKVLERTYTLGLIYLLDGDTRCAERAWTELEAASKFPDWNPRHFLDTAEMTHAFAIGYDWLYDFLGDSRRATLRAAMLEKGLLPALDCYRAKSKFGWWVASQYNWNQVCNGGITAGALAIADEMPDLAAEIVGAAVPSLKLAMAEFAPDGAWGEGPGYWAYATSYNVVMIAALESALGSDFGLPQAPGFSETGLFPMYMTGPTGRSFNFADAGEGVIRAPQLLWMARKFNRPEYAWFERQNAAPSAQDLVWFDEGAGGPKEARLALDKYYRHVEVATMRGAWEDNEATFVGFKAGSNHVNHSNLDLGSFVMEALGVRWAVDLGADNYNLPGYFGGLRWTYYRLRAEGHNPLLIAPGREPAQDPRAAAPIVRFESQPSRAFAVADLTAAYKGHTQSVTRGVALLDRKQVLVQDEIKAPKPADVWWFLHTHAKVELGADASATLTQDGARLWAKILSPAGAKFTVMDASPLPTSPHPEKQGDNKGVRKLAIHLENASDATLAVLLVPLRAKEAPPGTLPEVAPLQKW